MLLMVGCGFNCSINTVLDGMRSSWWHAGNLFDSEFSLWQFISSGSGIIIIISAFVGFYFSCYYYAMVSKSWHLDLM